jgi:hypothetical protein
MHNESHTAGAEHVSQDTLEAICKLALSGSTPEAISLALDLNVQTVRQVIARGDFWSQDFDLEVSQGKQAQLAQELQMVQTHSDVPTFIYSYEIDTEQLHRTNLVTGEHSSHRIPSYYFKYGCCWSELPGGSLLITGGMYGLTEVERIDTRREFAIARCPPMLTPRESHTAVYCTPHLYVLGGMDDNDDNRCLRECERYVCAENRWEALPPLPRACSNSSGVVIENSLYALGGMRNGTYLDLVQKLSLESLTWELMQFRLPFVSFDSPCFKLRDTEVYLVVNKTLCSFTGSEVRPLKTLTEDIESWFGASYYHNGTLYCSYYEGGVRSYKIGSLSN